MSNAFANRFVSDFGIMRCPEYYACVCYSAPKRKDGRRYDMRFRISRIARRIETHLNNRAKLRFMAGLPLDARMPNSRLSGSSEQD